MCVGFSQSADTTVTRILFVLDASSSMSDRWQSDAKFVIATRVLSSMLDSIKQQPGLEMALRVYGHRPSILSDCKDSRLEVPFGKNNADQIRNVLKLLKPQGTTPIAYALEQTVNDFPPCEECRNIVVLITDGLEACNGDPCMVSQLLQREGIFLRPFIIGIGGNMQSEFHCMGNYYDATVERDYRGALKTIMAIALVSSSAQISLLDQNGRPTVTDVQITMYDRVSGKAKYSFIHTLNEHGLPDTLTIDPLVTYDIVVQTIPPLRKESVALMPGEHTIISIDAAQGFLRFIHAEGDTPDCIIRKHGIGEAINVQHSDREEKYLAGYYDITVLTTPRMNFQNVEISPGQGTLLDIPQSGKAIFEIIQPVAGSLYMIKEGTMIWVSNLDNKSAYRELNLQPGNYRIIFRPSVSRSSSATKMVDFSIASGKETMVAM
jgi:Ca-activated chloride channel family protein